MPSSALTGIRVVDFSSGPAGGLATTVLADFGAEVVKVEPPTGDRFRAMPSSPLWLRGKKSAVLDLAEDAGRSRARELIRSADVVVVGGPPSRLRRWGIDASIRTELPHLVHCSVTGWGVAGPYSELPGYEGLVAAKFGRMAAFDVQLGQNRPVYSAVQVATHVASQAAVQGILAALIQRQRTKVGATVEASLVQALMPFDLVDVLARQIADRDGRTFTPLRHMSPMPTLNYHPLRAGDGVWIQCGNLLEHLFYSFLDAVDLLGEMLVEDQFQGSPATWSPDAIEDARDRILIRMQERPGAEWMQVFAENGNVAAEPIVSTAEAIKHPDLVDGLGLVTLPDDEHGEVTQIGPIAELTTAGANPIAGAPRIGADTEDVFASLAAHPLVGVETDAAQAGADGQPLAGLTILDLSTIIAAPLGVAMLADLGARVIKVEPLGGDPYRGLLIEGRMAVKTNVGKESICIDLKKPEGQAILHRMVADADVLVHNFRGEVPAKLGIDYDRLREIKPDLIWAVVNGYGPHGPGAKRPATHPVMGACTGGVALQAGAALTRDCPTLADVRENARQIMAANEANPDPNTSVVVASSILLALYNRSVTGSGQMVRINMQVANAWANSDDFLAYEGKPARPTVDDDHRGIAATYRLYPTGDGWVFLAVPGDADFARLCAVDAFAELGDDPRFATASGRAEHDGALADALERVFATRGADGWEESLGEAGVGCVRADGIEADRFITEDEHMIDNGWAPFIEHLRFGRFRRWGPVVTVAGPNPRYGTAPLAGEHTDRLLEEFGWEPGQIAELREAKVVASEVLE